MSTLTIDNILQQIDALPLPEQQQLRARLETKSPPAPIKAPPKPLPKPPPKPPLDRRLPNQPWPEAAATMQWLREHQHEYPGQWLALAGDRLVAVGASDTEVWRLAEQVGFSPAQVVVHYVAAADEPPFMGI